MAGTRRDHLKLIGVAGIAVPAFAQEHTGHGAGQSAGPHYAVPPVAPFEPKFFNAEEGLAISRLTDLIIPETDSPGAVKAGVPHYIDTILREKPEQGKLFRDGLLWLNQQAVTAHGKKFVELQEAEQVALVQPLCEAADKGNLKLEGVPFFHAVKNMTCDGYYTSYPGLVEELGYRGNQMMSAFEGCSHDH